MGDEQREGRNTGALAAVAGAAAAVAGVVGWRVFRRTTADRELLPRGRALITGASSGIGEEFARQLAAGGFDLTLVARREDRLQALAAELNAAYGIHADVLVADLSEDEGIARVADAIGRSPDITLLINNAGFGTNGDFLDVALERHLAMIHVHIIATVTLTKAALPAMIERGGGAIINVSSIASFFPSGGGVSYSASKVYLNNFSEALAAEIDGTGVKVQALCPGFTYSGFHDTPEFADFNREQIPDRLWMPATEVVQESLAALSGDRVIVIPGRVYRALVATANSPLQSAVRDAGRRIKRRWRKERASSVQD
ncbi:MAG: SDR family oxidoreductase [Anaerolineae bacterium]|nr:SDR family oxidoreductase [Anaerolineae bacterium]